MTATSSTHPSTRRSGTLSRLAGAGFLALVTSLTGGAAAQDCYVLSHAPAGLVGPPNPVRQGVPLSADQKKGVQAAIDMIKKWEEDCGVTPPGGGGILATSASDALGGMLTNGDICLEIRADPAKTGATASNPNTGNGPDGNGGTWSTFGHPGLNITEPQIPKPDPTGDFMSGGCSFDSGEVASLAGQLLHELQHLTNPPANPATHGDYEAPAYTYAAEQLCKVAGCDAASDAEKKAACEGVKASNKELCKFCKPQVECEACEDSEVTCKPKEKEEVEPKRTSASFAAATPVSVETPFGPDDTQLYTGDGWAGTISLRAVTDVITFAIYDQDTSFDLEFDLDSLPALTFDAQAFVQLAGDRLMIVGRDEATGEGEVVELVYDVPTAAVMSVNTVYQGAGFVGARDATAFDFVPGVSGVFILDAAHSLSVYLPWASTLVPLATTATAPGLANASYVSVRPIDLPGVPGFVAMTSDTVDTHLNNGTLVSGITTLIDVNLDGIIDLVL